MTMWERKIQCFVFKVLTLQIYLRRWQMFILAALYCDCFLSFPAAPFLATRSLVTKIQGAASSYNHIIYFLALGFHFSYPSIVVREWQIWLVILAHPWIWFCYLLWFKKTKTKTIKSSWVRILILSSTDVANSCLASLTYCHPFHWNLATDRTSERIPLNSFHCEFQ